MEISILQSDWLVPHHPIPNTKFLPITAFLNRSTYHKSAKGSPQPCPQILWVPQINEKAVSKRASNNHFSRLSAHVDLTYIKILLSILMLLLSETVPQKICHVIALY